MHMNTAVIFVHKLMHPCSLQEEEQKRLELEMQKRRERIEQWRAERKKKQELLPINIAPVSKKWSLEDEDDDDEEEEAKEGR